MFSCNVNDMCVVHAQNVYTCTSQSEYFSFAGVRKWNELPSEVYECFLSLKTGFRTRFNPSSFLLTDAPLVHPGHKSLSWLEPTRREEAILDELLIVAGIEGLPDPPNSPSSLDIQEAAVPNQSALDAFFDFDVSQCSFILVQISTAFNAFCCSHVLLPKRFLLGWQTGARGTP